MALVPDDSWPFLDASTSEQVLGIINYYVSLLIIQYHNKPKARATIALYASVMVCNAVVLAIRDAYNLDTAVGKQLDVLGKYAGIDRYYRELSLIDFFSTPDYHDTPTSPPQYGFETYATISTGNDFNGTLTYDKIISTANTLIDAYFRLIIKLKIIQNTINHSNKSIDDAMFQFFGAAVRPEESGPMTMAYFIASNPTPLIVAALYKHVFPKPMAVGLRIVHDVSGPMFDFTGYDGYQSPFGYGFATYANYDSLQGLDLTYGQISTE